MAETTTQKLYEQLAERYEERKDARRRDIFLVLAADAAQAAGRPAEAEKHRQKLLTRNPYHMLRPFSSFSEAIRSPDVLDYVVDLRRQFPLDVAERLWQQTPFDPAEESTRIPANPTPAFTPTPETSASPAKLPARTAPVSPYEPDAALMPAAPPAVPRLHQLANEALGVLLLFLVAALGAWVALRPYWNS
jgi:hypothetical protein